jgi:hypothetical protein
MVLRAAALLVTPIWAVWRLPYFFTVATYRDFPPGGFVGFVFGLRLRFDRAHLALQPHRGSILACAVWRGLYTCATGTAGASGTIQGMTSTFVYDQAFFARRARVARAQAWRSIDPRPASKRRSGVQTPYVVDPVTALSFRERAAKQRGTLPRSGRAPMAAK